MTHNTTIGQNLLQVFIWWIQQINKIFTLMKQIPIFPNISLFDILISLGIISVLISIIKFGLNSDKDSPSKNLDRVGRFRQ